VLAAPACEGKVPPAWGAPQILLDLELEDLELHAQLGLLVRPTSVRVAPVPAPEELGNGHIRAAVGALGRPEDLP
jgi:hypothetical protein